MKAAPTINNALRGIAGIALLAVAGIAQANPTAPVVVSGTATFATSGNLLNVTNSTNAIINWNSFSIGVGELTRFIQPSAASAVLNRVTGQDPSAILGALQSNGRVFLLNPNGIVFGAGSQVNVAGLVASTLALSDADFLAGRLRFTGVANAGTVVNQGAITAASGGQVYLVGSGVTNSGVITAPSGEVVLAAGNSVELVDPGTPNLRVEIVAPDNEARNLSMIAAESGRVGIYAGLIHHAGTVQANTAVSQSGRILLKATRRVVLANGSLLSAAAPNGGNGGFIETLAEEITVAENATISAAAPLGQSGTWLLDSSEANSSAGNIAINGTPIVMTSGNITISTSVVNWNGGNITLAPSHTSGVSLSGGNIAINGGTITVASGNITLNGGGVTVAGAGAPSPAAVGGSELWRTARENSTFNGTLQRIPGAILTLQGVLLPAGNFLSPLQAPVFASRPGLRVEMGNRSAVP